MRTRANVALFALMIGAGGCAPEGDEPSEQEGFDELAIELNTNEKAIDLVLAGKDEDGGPAEGFSSDHLGTDYSSGWDGQKYLLCRTDRFSAKASTDEVIALSPHAGVLYPGALVRGSDANSGTLTPVLLPRSGGSVALDENVFVSGPGASKTRPVTEFRADVVGQQIDDILRSNQVTTAARSAFVMEEAKTFEEGMLKIGLDVSKAKQSIKGDFQSRSWSDKTNLLVKLTQVYYTAYPVLPYPAQVFRSDVTGDDVEKTTGAKDPILYVSSVSYGRTLIMRVESEKSGSELRAAVNAAFSGSVNVAASLSAEHKQTLESSRIEVFTVGGEANGSVQIIQGPSQLEGYLKSGASWSLASPGVPISYTLRALKSGKPYASKYASDFIIPSCTAGADKDKVQISFDHIQFQRTGDNLGKGDIRYRICLKVGGGEECFDNGSRQTVRDGATLAINGKPAPFEMMRTGDMSSFSISVDIWDENKPIFGPWFRSDGEPDEVKYTYDPATKTWTPNKSLRWGEGSKFDRELVLTVDRISPCGENYTWERETGLCKPPPENGPRFMPRLAYDETSTPLTFSASASSTYSGYAVARIFDGDLRTDLGEAFSWANQRGAPLPQSVQLDASTDISVQHVDVYTTAQYPIADYDLEVFTGSKWLPFARVRGNTAAMRTSSVTTPIRGRAVRVVGFRGPAHQPGYVRVNEIVLR